MVFGAGIPCGTTWSESVRSIVRAIFTRNSWQKKKGTTKGVEERGKRNERRSGRQERNEGDDLSPSFCSPRLSLYTSSGYLFLPRFSFVRYSSSFSLLSSFHGTLVELRAKPGSGCPPTVSSATSFRSVRGVGRRPLPVTIPSFRAISP